MNYFCCSSGLSAGDCCGGHVSMRRASSIFPRLSMDTMECLKIPHSHFSQYFSQRIRLDKVGNMFSAWYFNQLFPEGIFLGEVEISVGDTVTLDFEFHNFYVELYRYAKGNDGSVWLEFVDQQNEPWGRPWLDSEDDTPYYVLLYLVLEEDTYIDHVSGSNHYFPGLALDQEIIPNHLTEPTTVSWTDVTEPATTLPAGVYPIWIENIYSWSPDIAFWSGFGEVEISLIGSYGLVEYSTKKRYQVYGEYDGGKIEGTLLAESDTLPIAVQLETSPTSSREYRLRLVEQTKYGIQSQNILLDQYIKISIAGEDITKPDPPDSFVPTVLEGGRLKIAVNISFDAFIGTPVALVKVVADGVAYYEEVHGSGTYEIVTEPFSWGDSVLVEASVIDTSLRESESISGTTVVYFDVSEVPAELISYASAATCVVGFQSGIIRLEDGDALLFGEGGMGTRLYLDGDMVLEITDDYITMSPGWTLKNESISGASTEYLEDAGSGIYYLGDGTTRRVKFDTVNKVISATSFKQPIEFQCPLEGPVELEGGRVRFQYLSGKYNTWLYLDGSDVYTIDWRQSDE